MDEYDGGLGEVAARKDDGRAAEAWLRIWPQVSERLFGGRVLRVEPFGSDNDAHHGIDAYVGDMLIGLRVQNGRFKTFTVRKTSWDKLRDGRDRTRYQVQAYLQGELQGPLVGPLTAFGCVKTDDLKDYLIKHWRDAKLCTNGKNGVPFRCPEWVKMADAGYRVVTNDDGPCNLLLPQSHEISREEALDGSLWSRK